MLLRTLAFAGAVLAIAPCWADEPALLAGACRETPTADCLLAEAETIVDATDEWSRPEARRDIALAQVRVGRPDEASATAWAIDNSLTRAQTLHDIASGQRAPEPYLDALRAAFEIDLEGVDNQRVVDEIAGSLVEAGFAAGALDAASALGPWERYGQGAIVMAMAEAGQATEALAAARRIDGLDTPLAVLLAVVTAGGHPELEAEMIAAARQGWSPPSTLAEIAAALNRPALIDEALALAGRIADVDGRSSAYAAIAGAQARMGSFAAARETAGLVDPALGYEGMWLRGDAFAEVAEAQAAAGEIEPAMDTARAMGAQPEHACCYPVDTLVRIAEIANRPELLAEAWEASRAIPDDWERREAARRIIWAQTELGLVPEVEIAQSTGNEDALDGVLASLAIEEARAGRFSEAAALVGRIRAESAWERMRAVGEIAPRLAAAGRLDEALSLAREASATEPEGWRGAALAGVAAELAGAGRVGDALAAADGIADVAPRVRALAGVAAAIAGGPTEASLAGWPDPRTPGEIEAFRDWLLGCTPGLTCTALGLPPEGGGAALEVGRRYADDRIRLGLTLYHPEMEPMQAGDSFQVTVSQGGRELYRATWRHRPGEADYLVRPETGSEAALLAAALAGDRLVASGRGLAWETSLLGATAALLRMDELQSRVGTPSAIVRPGDGVRQERPGRPPDPAIAMLALEEVQPAPAAPAGLPPSEDSSCLHRPALAWQVAGAETVLWGVCSWIGGPNSFYRFFAVGSGDVRALEFDHPESSQSAQMEISEPSLADGQIVSTELFGQMGRCGTRARWAWDSQGERPELVFYAEMPECRGVISDAWPVLLDVMPDGRR